MSGNPPRRNVPRQPSRNNKGANPKAGGKKKAPAKPIPPPPPPVKPKSQPWWATLFGCTSNAANDVASPGSPPVNVRVFILNSSVVNLVLIEFSFPLLVFLIHYIFRTKKKTRMMSMKKMTMMSLWRMITSLFQLKL